MPVQIGAKSHSFSNPMALLSDCHRRIEMFLGSLEQVAEMLDQPLPEEAQTALASALRYFRESAPKHTADEEESLFPRLRQVQSGATEAAITALGMLEREHAESDQLHAEVQELGSRQLDRGQLTSSEISRFGKAVSELRRIYQEHIRIEDTVVFPAADRSLSGREKGAIAQEMAARRGITAR
jgi:hemerythrin-like domain-containing protein